MKAKITILDSSQSAYKDDYNFIAFMASKSFEDPPITNFQGHKGVEDNENYQDKLLDSFNEILRE